MKVRIESVGFFFYMIIYNFSSLHGKFLADTTLFEHITLYILSEVMKRKFQVMIINPISIKHELEFGNSCVGLGQAHKCGRVKRVNGISNPLDMAIHIYYAQKDNSDILSQR